MFTGIVTATARLVSLEKRRDTLLTIHAPGIEKKLKIGDSLGVNGVCLTLAEKRKKEQLLFHISRETLERTNFSDLTPGNMLNVELPLRLGDLLSGHWVMGHIDGTVRLRSIRRGDGQNRFCFTYMTREWKRYLVAKGSVALNGVSLTLVEVHPTWFSVEVISHTLNATNLRLLRVGERMNIELDFIGKYLYNFIQERLK